MSDVVIDIVELLIELGKLPADVSMSDALDYIFALPKEDQEYLLERCVYGVDPEK